MNSQVVENYLNNIQIESKTKLKIYDKVKWHIEGNKGTKDHIEIIMNWLFNKKLLSKEGIEVYKLGIDNETSIHSGMLNSTGLKIMDKCYSIWIKNISKSKKLDIKVFEKCAKK